MGCYGALHNRDLKNYCIAQGAFGTELMNALPHRPQYPRETVYGAARLAANLPQLKKAWSAFRALNSCRLRYLERAWTVHLCPVQDIQKALSTV